MVPARKERLSYKDLDLYIRALRYGKSLNRDVFKYRHSGGEGLDTAYIR